MNGRSTILAAVVPLVLFGCTRPVLTEDDPNDLQPEGAGLGFNLVEAAFWTNGTLRSDRVSIEAVDFKILFVYLPESGLYIVTLDETDGASQSALFVGNDLVFVGGRTEVRFRSSGGHLFSDRVDREGWVEYLPGANISRPGAPSSDVVVGHAMQRSQVPGLRD